MVSLMSLWIPILLSAVLVFIVSSIIHMMLSYHRSDFSKLAAEAEIMDALRKFNIAPGDYYFPYASSNEEMKSPEFAKKAEQGPVIFMTVMPNGMMQMGKSLMLWFVYCVVIGVFAAYVAGVVLPAGTAYMTVFRITGTVAFAGYALALMQNTIWYKRNPMATAKSVFDGLVYALVTAGVFGWLWP